MTRLTFGSSSEEIVAAKHGELPRDHVLRRLEDWRDRVHALYDDIERALAGMDLRIDRSGKHTSAEELPQRVHLAPDQQPAVDIMHILRPDGTNAAILLPRSVWIIGANGRIDLRLPRTVGSEAYMLIDDSEPFSRPTRWMRVPVGLPFDREPFNPQWLANKLQ